jgi:cobalamin biosynthesis Mg chelatase CobN
MIVVTCAGCDKELKVQDALAGKLVRCRGCSATMRVPGAKTDAAAAVTKTGSAKATRATRTESALKAGNPPAKRRATVRAAAREEPDVEDQDERAEEPARRRKRRNKRAQAESSPMTMVLACLGVAFALYSGLVLWAVFAHSGRLALLIVGGVLFVCGRLWFIHIARQEAVLTSVLVRFVPFYSISLLSR